MKNFLISFALVLASVSGVAAQSAPDVLVHERSQKLTEKMAADLRLNNYQATKMLAINKGVINKMAEAEQKYSDNPALEEKVCKGLCVQRDRALEDVLSTEQYSRYFSNRVDYYQLDKEYARSRQTSGLQTRQEAVPSGK